MNTWEWDGTAWHLAATAGPSLRSGHGLAFDSVRSRIVLFGGYSGPPYTLLNDTWEWDGTSWLQISTTGPAGQSSPALVFDAARGRTIMFASNSTGWLYEWNGATWAERALPGPGVRSGAALVYDSSRARTILFGGANQNYTNYLNDLWEYDGVAWTLRTPSGSAPRRRFSAGLAYDAAREKVIMVGGNVNSSPYEPDGTWEYDPVALTWMHPTANPGPLAGGQMVYDIARARAVILGASQYGAYGTAGLLWEYDASGTQDLRLDIPPASQTVALYAPATFSVVSPGAVAYRWYRYGQPLSDSGTFSGTTTATLSIGRCGLSLNASYSVVVQGPCGPAASARAELYVNPEGCYPNCDGSTAHPVLTANDFQCYLNDYAAGTSYANCDGSTSTPLLTANDFQCFLNRYAEGCN
jgi:hypothetical protein